MYCPSCGNSVNSALKFCNGCGMQLTRETVDIDGTPSKMLDKILRTLFLIVFVGLGILVGLVAVLLGNDVRPDAVMLITFLYLLLVFGICFSLARQIPKLIDARLKGWSNMPNVLMPEQLRSPSTGRIEEYREPVMSVTDHTTKTLDRATVKDG